MTVTYRPLRWWDLSAARELERGLFPSDAWTAEQFWSELAQPSRTYVAAVEAERLVAYAGLSRVGTDADIQTVAVATDQQGRGLARTMLQHLLEGADAIGVTHTFLEVRADNVPALRLYASLGFEEISRRPRYYADGSDAVIMRRPRPQAGS